MRCSMKQNIIVMFGGASPERDISIITAIQCMNALNGSIKFNILPIYCDNNWHMFFSKKFFDLDTFKSKKIVGKKVLFDHGYMYSKSGSIIRKMCKVDCAILCFHGGLGEGGGIQGLLEIQGIPYTSPSVLSSAILQDKCTFKDLLERNNIPTLDYITVCEDDYIQNKEQVLDRLNTLGYPIILKPSKLGSSIGIEVVHNIDELDHKIGNTFLYGTRVLAEKYVKDFDEINCACVCIDGELVVSRCELVKKSDEILSYSDKYMGGSKSMDSMTRKFDPQEYKDQVEYIKDMTKRLYLLFDLSGIVRVDYIVKDGIVYVNEVNSIPGSLANYLFEYDYDDLMTRVIHSAQIHYLQQKHKVTYFTSSVLNNYNGKKLRK